MSTLLEKRMNILKENERLIDEVEAKGRSFNDDELRTFSNNILEADALEETIKAAAKNRERMPSAPAPSLLDGGGVKRFNTIKSQDGIQHRCFSKGQRMADCYPQSIDGMGTEAFGAGLIGLLTNNRSGVEAEVRALSESINSAGGLFVSESVAAAITDASRNSARCFQAGANLMQMGSETTRIISIDSDPTIAEVGENALIPSSDPAFGSRLLVAKKHGVLVKVSNELISDGVGAAAAITGALSSAWATYLDALILSYLFDESGVGETETVGAITFDDLLLAQWSTRNLNGEPNALLLNSKTSYALNLLRDQVTGSYLQAPAALSSVQMLDTNAVADTHCVMGDFTQAVVGVRGGLSIEISREAGESYQLDQSWIRLLWRGDVTVLRKHFHILDGLTY